MKEGKVQRWGMCEVGADTIRKAHVVCPLTAIQGEYHLMHRLTEENGVLDICRELGIGFVPYSPLNRGALGSCINEYTVFGVHNNNRQTLPRFQPGSDTGTHPYRECTANLWPYAGYDFGKGSARLVTPESTVDCSYFWNN